MYRIFGFTGFTGFIGFTGFTRFTGFTNKLLKTEFSKNTTIWGKLRIISNWR